MKFDSMFDCPRCEAKGYIAEFRHIKNGVCFLCGGAKKIKSNTKYTRKGALLCEFTKGHTKMYDEKNPQKWNLVYREVLSFSFDGGNRVYGGYFITDENRLECRELWKWFKSQGARMIVTNDDK